MSLGRSVVLTVSIGTAVTVVATIGIVYAMTRPPQVDPVPNPDSSSRSACRPVNPPPGSAAPHGVVSYNVSKRREHQKRTATFGLSVADSVGVAIEPPEVEKDGTDWQSATVTLHDLSVTGEWGNLNDEWDAAKGGAELAGTIGQRVTLGVRMPAEKMGDFDWRTPPDPLNPLALPVDGSMTLNRSTYGSIGLTASYRMLRGSLDVSREEAMTVAVTRLKGSTVRVLVGPTDTVSAGLSVGLGTDDYNVSLVGGTSIARSKLEQADYDLSTPEGLEAYFGILLRGKLHEPGAVAATHYGERYAHNAGIELRLKDLKIGDTRTWADNSRLITENRDGSRAEELGYRENDNTMNLVGSSEPGDEEITMTDYQLRLKGAKPEDLVAFNEEYANLAGTKITRPQNLVLSFEPEDMKVFRQQALEIMAHQIRGIASRPDVDRYGGQPEFDENTTAKDVESWIERTRKSGEFDQEFGLLKRLTLDNGYSPVMLYIVKEDGAILHDIWRGVGVGSTDATPKNSLRWLRDWAEAAEKATGYDAEGPGSTICRGEVMAAPAEKPGIPSDSNCGPLRDGMIAVLARGDVPCSEVLAVLEKFERNPAQPGQYTTIDGWRCQVFGTPTPEIYSNYSIAPICLHDDNLIRVWPADSPYPEGEQVDLDDFDVPEDFSTGDVYTFHTSDTGFACSILPPTDDDGPGGVRCRGRLPKGAEATDPVSGDPAPATQVWLERPNKPRYQAVPAPHVADPMGQLLPPGRVLAAHGVACTTGKDDMVRCVNGKHQFTLRIGASEFS